MILTECAHMDWKRKAQEAKKPIVLLSPYLTGKIPSDIIGTQYTGKIYTLFDVELFASNSSSLPLIKQLFEAGHKLFKLDRLHAKVVVEPSTFATLGSQNATTGGTQNLELSVCYTDKPEVAKIHRKIQPWLKNAKPITQQMITAMDAAVKPLMKRFTKLQAECTDAQAKIDQEARLSEKKLAREKLARDRAKLRSEIKHAVSLAPISAEWNRGTIKYRSDSMETSLISEKPTLLDWTVNGKEIPLKRLSRYLCVTDLGEIGWARVAGTRISMIGRGVSFQTSVFPDHPNWRIRVEAQENKLEGLPSEANLLVTVTDEQQILCLVPMRFALSSYKCFSPRVGILSQGGDLPEGKQARKWIRENLSYFGDQVVQRITRTFKYGANLTGDDARFYGEVGSTHVIRIALNGNNPYLLVKKGWLP